MVMKAIMVALVLTLGAGCSSSDPPAPEKKAQTTPKLRKAVEAYTAAFLGGDAEAAYSLLTERCHGETAAADFKRIVDQAHAEYGNESILSYADKVDGQVATVTYELTDPYLNQDNERWLLEDGTWHNDEC